MSQLFASDGQSIGASASVLPVNIQCWFPLGLISLITLQSRDSQESSPAPQLKSTDFSVLVQPSYGPTLTSVCDYIALTIGIFVCDVPSLLLTTLSRLAVAFLPRSRRLCTSWLQLPCMCAQFFSCVWFFATPWTVAASPLSTEFSRQEYWSGLSCPPVEDLPYPEVEPMSPASLVLQVDSLPTEPPGKPLQSPSTVTIM